MKQYTESTLKGRTKDELIEIIRCLENNVKVLEEMNANLFKLLMEKDMYAWHDLRKNPEDLPPYNKDVLVCCVNQSGKNAQFVMWYNEYEGWLFQNDKPCCEQIAWRYIEPFEEDNE